MKTRFNSDKEAEHGGFSHTEGGATRATGRAAHAEGMLTEAGGDNSHAEGSGSLASGTSAHAEGLSTMATGNFGSHAEGAGTTASGEYGSHAEGINTKAIGGSSHAEGTGTVSRGDSAHAEGFLTTASGEGSHAEGGRTGAYGHYSHAEGNLSRAEGIAAHAEGESSSASGTASHAEGRECGAVGPASHAEGISTLALGIASHAEGKETKATGNFSHAEGNFTSTKGYEGAHIMGKYGDAIADYGWFMANGSDSTNKNLSACILNSGDAYFRSVSTSVPSACAHFAEIFETIDGNPIEPGYFVTLVGDKIRKANSTDSYILGVSSANPAVLVGSAELGWHGKYLNDEWGRPLYYDMIIPTVIDKDKKLIKLAKIESQPKINPEWNRNKKYVPRSLRPEWVAVGLIGQILLRDDGTCEVDGFCRPNDEGVATASITGYRVLKRNGPDQITILFR